jgi:hypothetical protein
MEVITYLCRNASSNLQAFLRREVGCVGNANRFNRGQGRGQNGDTPPLQIKGGIPRGVLEVPTTEEDRTVHLS